NGESVGGPFCDMAQKFVNSLSNEGARQKMGRQRIHHLGRIPILQEAPSRIVERGESQWSAVLVQWKRKGPLAFFFLARRGVDPHVRLPVQRIRIRWPCRRCQQISGDRV